MPSGLYQARHNQATWRLGRWRLADIPHPAERVHVPGARHHTRGNVGYQANPVARRQTPAFALEFTLWPRACVSTPLRFFASQRSPRPSCSGSRTGHYLRRFAGGAPNIDFFHPRRIAAFLHACCVRSPPMPARAVVLIGLGDYTFDQQGQMPGRWRER